mmetsp:Transcript_114470/g.370004  ORF Transcript_114470/g.370004 Transcript_114470/m.370004 type:complete len:177 (+) Transcript_114470:1480-2010(+)
MGQPGAARAVFPLLPGLRRDRGFPDNGHLAKREAARLGDGVPIWLSEYFAATPQEVADQLASAVELGCNAATFWHYADTGFTNTDGWFKYGPEVAAAGGLFDRANKINMAAWPAYEETVRNGTFWGGEITGACGAQMDVLKLVPHWSALSWPLQGARGPATPGHFRHFREPRVPRP